jgi:hypothetical protein
MWATVRVASTMLDAVVEGESAQGRGAAPVLRTSRAYPAARPQPDGSSGCVGACSRSWAITFGLDQATRRPAPGHPGCGCGKTSWISRGTVARDARAAAAHRCRCSTIETRTAAPPGIQNSSGRIFAVQKGGGAAGRRAARKQTPVVVQEGGTRASTSARLTSAVIDRPGSTLRRSSKSAGAEPRQLADSTVHRRLRTDTAYHCGFCFLQPFTQKSFPTALDCRELFGSRLHCL